MQCTRLTIQLLNAVARLPNLADLNLAQFDLAAAARCETVLPWPLLAQLASLRSLTALDLSHVMIQEQQACVVGYALMHLLQQWRRLYMDCFPLWFKLSVHVAACNASSLQYSPVDLADPYLFPASTYKYM